MYINRTATSYYTMKCFIHACRKMRVEGEYMRVYIRVGRVYIRVWHMYIYTI